MATFETRDTFAEKAAKRFGLNQPTGLDLINRADYSSDEAYLDAATKAELERNSPEYRDTYRKLQAQYEESKAKEKKERSDAYYRECRHTVTLTSYEREQAEAAAKKLAGRDLSAGRISADDFGIKQKEYYDKEIEKAKDSAASNQLMNAMFRGEI